MTGISFANRLAEFLKSNKNEFVRDPITVEANPDQSKHLETAKMKLWDIELDLVNLRAEEYAEDSRIPNQIVCNVLRAPPLSSSLIPSTASRLVPPLLMRFEETSQSTACSTTCIPVQSKILPRRYVWSG